MTTGGAVMSRARAMKGVLVPLPAPGAPPSQMNSRGKRRVSLPCRSSRSAQTAEKMSWASLTSRSVTAGAGLAAGSSTGLSVGVGGAEGRRPHTAQPIRTGRPGVRQSGAAEGEEDDPQIPQRTQITKPRHLTVRMSWVCNLCPLWNLWISSSLPPRRASSPSLLDLTYETPPPNRLVGRVRRGDSSPCPPAPGAPAVIRTEAELDDRLSEPTPAVIDTLARHPGDVVLLGAAGKMGPSLARMARRAADARGDRRRVVAVSRFSAGGEEAFRAHGVETVACDLLDPRRGRPAPRRRERDPPRRPQVRLDRRRGRHLGRQLLPARPRLPALPHLPGRRVLDGATSTRWPPSPAAGRPRPTRRARSASTRWPPSAASGPSSSSPAGSASPWRCCGSTTPATCATGCSWTWRGRCAPASRWTWRRGVLQHDLAGRRERDGAAGAGLGREPAAGVQRDRAGGAAGARRVRAVRRAVRLSRRGSPGRRPTPPS